jgi:ribosome-binding protein aMBF1 (putative translation factor)
MNQDWEPIQIHGKSLTIKPIINKVQNKIPVISKQYKEIDQASDAGKLKQLQLEDRQTMISMRTNKKLKQDQIAGILSMPVNLYKDIENGKTIPTQQQLQRINNYLKINLKLS